MTCLKSMIFGAAIALTSTATFAQDLGENLPPLDMLSGGSLRAAFSDITVDGTYKRPRERSGTSRFTETFNADGTTVYREGDIRDTGRWVMPREDVVCFTYDGPMAGGYSCYTLFRDGTCLYAYHPSRVKNGAPIDPNAWSAKTVNKGELSTCDDLVG